MKRRLISASIAAAMLFADFSGLGASGVLRADEGSADEDVPQEDYCESNEDAGEDCYYRYSGYYQKDEDGNWQWVFDNDIDGFWWTDEDGKKHWFDCDKDTGSFYRYGSDYKSLFYQNLEEEIWSDVIEIDIDWKFVPETTGLEGFVTRLYSVVLGRQPDYNGYYDWCQELRNGECTGKEIADGFLDSPEFINKGLSDSEYIEVLYNVFFNRHSDANGLAGWVSVLASGTSRQEIRDGFYNSTEWANTCLSYGIRSGGTGTPTIFPNPSEKTINFVKGLYRECLGREADSQGLNEWATKLARQEISGKEAAYGFIYSQEFLDKASKMSDDDLITVFYKVFLDRTPDEYGLEAWKARMIWGDAVGIMFSGVADSDEFRRKCISYGILAGDSINVDGYSVEPEFLDFATYVRDEIDFLDSAPLNSHATYTEYTYLGDHYTTRQCSFSDREIQVLEQFAADHFAPNWTPGMKVVYTAWWITKNSDYADGGLWGVISGKGYADAIINYHLGQCVQYNGCLLEMMAWLGYDVNMMFVPRNYGGGWQHYWCDVTINGQIYYFDAGNESHSDPAILINYAESNRYQFRPGYGLAF